MSTNAVPTSAARPAHSPLWLAAGITGVVSFVVAGAVAWVVTDDPAPPRTPGLTEVAVPDATATTPVTSVPAATGTVVFEPATEPVAHPFVPTAVPDPSPPPASLPALESTSSTTGGQAVRATLPGLYGGTRGTSTCPVDAIAEYLATNPAVAELWADQKQIDPSVVREALESSTPVVLTRDTLVTHHGLVDGDVVTYPAILQAGHAVLLDESGRPGVLCNGADPLSPPIGAPEVPVGEPWPDFTGPKVVTVEPATTPVEALVIVDLLDGGWFVRPTGTSLADTDIGPDTLCTIDPLGCATATTTTATTTTATTTTATTTTATTTTVPHGPPTGEIEVVAEVGNVYAVVNGATRPFRFTLDRPTYITSIRTYHWNDGRGRRPGTIALERRNGDVYGPYRAEGSDGQGGVPNANWTVMPGVVLPAGTYQVVDSHPGTWSWNDETNGVGMGEVLGIVVRDGRDPDRPDHVGGSAEP